MLIRKPKEISWEVAAGIPETWITAIQAMYFVASFAPGKSILWHAGASSVSIAGIQLSKAHGASAIYATVGSSSKVEFCKDLGVTGVYTSGSVAENSGSAWQGAKISASADILAPTELYLVYNSINTTLG